MFKIMTCTRYINYVIIFSMNIYTTMFIIIIMNFHKKRKYFCAFW